MLVELATTTLGRWSANAQFVFAPSKYWENEVKPVFFQRHLGENVKAAFCGEACCGGLEDFQSNLYAHNRGRAACVCVEVRAGGGGVGVCDFAVFLLLQKEKGGDLFPSLLH